MHTDEGETNLPISLVRPKFLAWPGGTQTYVRMHRHKPEQTEQLLSFCMEMSNIVFLLQKATTAAFFFTKFFNKT